MKESVDVQVINSDKWSSKKRKEIEQKIKEKVRLVILG